jgi:tetratricopeptide (TPR) repeat protein
MYHRIWLHSGQADHFRDFESAMAKALALHPQSQIVRSIAGDRYLHAYRLTNRDEYLRAAITEYERAVEIYPNSSLRHAQLAWAWNVAREPEKAEREAHVALDLDAKNPHTEQKLQEQTLFDVEPDPHFSSQPAAAGDDRVEPLMIRLRSTSRTSHERPSRYLSALRTRL